MKKPMKWIVASSSVQPMRSLQPTNCPCILVATFQRSSNSTIQAPNIKRRIAAADPADSRPLIQHQNQAATLQPMNLAFKHQQQRSIVAARRKIKVRAAIRAHEGHRAVHRKGGDGR
ncbi:hypothetical protein Dimus_016138, partial [Dionaea muscipula]